MKKIFKKIFKISLLSALTGILTIVIIILFPQQLFAKKVSYKKFTVYSNHDVDGNITTVLDNALVLVQKSELYDSSYEYNIIFCNGSFYNKIDDKVLGIGRAARTTLNNVIVKVKVDVKDNLAFPVFRKSCLENLTELIAHEMVHCLQAHKYGNRKFNPFNHPAFWKLEGYPEYIAKKNELSGNAYSLSSDIDRFLDLSAKATDIWILSDDNDCEVPNYYYKGKLMMEYLMDIRHLSYDQILKDTTPEDTIYQEMIKWNNEEKNKSKTAL